MPQDELRQRAVFLHMAADERLRDFALAAAPAAAASAAPQNTVEEQAEDDVVIFGWYPRDQALGARDDYAVQMYERRREQHRRLFDEYLRELRR